METETKEQPLIAKYEKKENCLYCPECKTFEVMCDASGELSVPHGFGFIAGSTKFAVVRLVLKGWFGECELCHKRIFNYASKKVSITHPKSINDKLTKCV